MDSEQWCTGSILHNYTHVVSTLTASGTGQSVTRIFLYCTQCADLIEVDQDWDERN